MVKFMLGVAAALAAQSTPSADFTTAPAMAGNWTYAATSDGSEATFADAYGHAQLSLHCMRSTRRVSVARPISASAATIAIWTSDGSRSVATTYDTRAAELSADFAAYDPILDSIASSRGRFAVSVSVSGQPALVVPPWPEVARVIEDCRV